MSNDLTGQVVVSRSEQLEAGDAERQFRRRTGRHGGYEGQGRGQCQVLQGRDAGVNHCSGEELFGQPRDRPQQWGCSGGVRRGWLLIVAPSVRRLKRPVAGRLIVPADRFRMEAVCLS